MSVFVAELLFCLRLSPGPAKLDILAGVSKLCDFPSLSTSNTYIVVRVACIEVRHTLPGFSGKMMWLMNDLFAVLDV